MNRHLPARQIDVPASLVDVAESLGVPVVTALIEHFGGLEVKFPQHPQNDHPILCALGQEAGLALCEFLGGQSIYVPHGRASTLRADILALEAQGLDRTAIARTLRISQRHVRRLANRRDDDRQRDLFR